MVSYQTAPLLKICFRLSQLLMLQPYDSEISFQHLEFSSHSSFKGSKLHHLMFSDTAKDGSPITTSLTVCCITIPTIRQSGACHCALKQFIKNALNYLFWIDCHILPSG